MRSLLGKCACSIMEVGSRNTPTDRERRGRMTLKLSRKTDVLNIEVWVNNSSNKPVVMTDCSWSGFGRASESQLFKPDKELMTLRADSHVPILVTIRKTAPMAEMRSSNFWDITRRRCVVGYRRYGTVYQSHFKSQAVQHPWPLKMGLRRCPETSVPSYQSTLRDIPQ